MINHGTCGCLECRSFPLTTSRCRKCKKRAFGMDYETLLKWSYFDDTVEWECYECQASEDPMEIDH